jgi:putative iron-regulated protein
MTSFTRGLLSALPLLLVSLTAPPALAQTTAQTAQTVDSATVARHYAGIVQAGYEDALAGALDLQKAVQAFTATPTPAALDAARKAWLAAREWYGQTEAFRFYGGPIDDDNGPEGRMNSWPMDESFVDGVKGKPASGLINDTRVLISKANLIRYNERGGEENIAAGWHAIEFLLWGQDLSADGPGNRSADEFIDGKAPNADRRRQYLGVATELLVDDLRYLVGAWVGGAANYRARFERGDIESMRKIIVGIGSLSRGELAGERMEVALNTQDQEDEHSCFSDNTHRDIVNNALGIENVWLGRFQRRDGSSMDGPSLRSLVAARDPALAERTTKQIAESVQDAKAIQPPFDREITGGADAAGRQRIQKTIASLVAQSKSLADAAAAIGITRLTLVNPKR